jgi:hypothetical protein
MVNPQLLVQGYFDKLEGYGKNIKNRVDGKLER